MKNRVRKYIDELFQDIYETNQLIELKEEMTTNLLDKINDFISNGDLEDIAFKKAVSSLGDMNELISNFKKASESKVQEDFLKPQPIDQKHVMGYVLGSIFSILGLIVAALGYALSKDYRTGLFVLFSAITMASVIFVFLGLTQETVYTHPMKVKRAAWYAIASGASLKSIFGPLMIYLYGANVYAVLLLFVVIGIPSIGALIYLALTEKSRSKLNMMDLEWQSKWLQYYMTPQRKKTKDYLSGALWMFTVALFLLGILNGFRHSWILFIFAAGIQVVIEGFFQPKGK